MYDETERHKNGQYAPGQRDHRGSPTSRSLDAPTAYAIREHLAQTHSAGSPYRSTSSISLSDTSTNRADGLVVQLASRTGFPNTPYRSVRYA